ncbi:GTP-binding protein [Nocardia vinacea]|uniref:GTP-binding protein n=1 Tax=Nocardia vinacea TaxID=96468 RepID=A0ABZ1Z346_9NOCA|nr:GTP-binding protein [Nocardia vinacea]
MAAWHTTKVEPRRYRLDGPCAVITWPGNGKEVWGVDPDGSVFTVWNRKQVVASVGGLGLSMKSDSTRAISFGNNCFRVWDTATWHVVATRDLSENIVSAKWSPEGRSVALVSRNGTVFVYSAQDPLGKEQLRFVISFTQAGKVVPITWNDEKRFTYTVDGTDLCQADIGLNRHKMVVRAHDGYDISDITGLDDGRTVTVGIDGTMRVFRADMSLDRVYESPSGNPLQLVSVARYHGNPVACAVDSNDILHITDLNKKNETISIRTDTGPVASAYFAGFSADGAHIAIASSMANEVLQWDTAAIFRAHRNRGTQFKNAKIVLVGDSGVGKSGLALTLAGEEFVPTASTHGRNVVTLSRDKVELPEEGNETREVHLWDLAGQPGYRVSHQLSLSEVSVAVTVFDARSETDPFRGISYWHHAMQAASARQTARMARILVSARTDRSTLGVSRERIEQIQKKFSFDWYIETSARTGRGVEELRQKVAELIDWESITPVVAPDVFIEIRKFLLSAKSKSNLISGESELYNKFCTGHEVVSQPVFRLCLQRLETAGIVFRLSIGDQWLLQPELLDNYVAWLSQAARSEPDGLGSISEERAIRGDFDHDVLEVAADEKLMLLAAVQEVVERGIAIRVSTDRGQVLTFPSELRQDIDDYPGEYEHEMRMTFRGPISAIYAATTVRLLNSLFFGPYYRLYRNCAVFTSQPPSDRNANSRNAAEVCGYIVRYPDVEDESVGELDILFSDGVSVERKLSFLRYVDFQLRQMTLPDSIVRRRLYRHCEVDIPEGAIEKRKRLGKLDVICSVCGVLVDIKDYPEGAMVADEASYSIQSRAFAEQGKQQRLITLDERISRREFDTFICYNTADRRDVMNIRRELLDAGIAAWTDVADATDRIIRDVDNVLASVPTAIIALGANSVGIWQEHEYYSLLSRAVMADKESTRITLIPVLLRGAPDIREMPPMLRPFRVIDMRGKSGDDATAAEESAGATIAELVEAIVAGRRGRW